MQIDHKADGFPDQTEPSSSSDIDGLQPLKTIRSRWPAIIGGLVTLAMLGGLAHELLSSGLDGLERATPHSPWFYLAFLALYFIPPLAITGSSTGCGGFLRRASSR